MTKSVEVKRVDQSPLNPRRWCVELACGHEVWVTSSKKPKAKTMICPECSRS